MEKDKCVCVSATHDNGDQPCKGEVVFRIKAQGASKMVGICKACWHQPPVELPSSVAEDREIKSGKDPVNPSRQFLRHHGFWW
jgi:hypothetical protein